jgi:hypothetical protein
MLVPGTLFLISRGTEAGPFPTGNQDPYSVSSAVQNLLLASHHAGLGVVWADVAAFFTHA